MKIFVILALIISTHAFSQGNEFSSDRTATQIELFNELEKPWGMEEGITPEKAFGAIKRLIDRDPFSKELYAQVASKLKASGSMTVEDMIRFCDEDGFADGGFSQSTTIVEAGVKFTRDIPPRWSESALIEVQKSYSSGVMSLAFLDVLLVFGEPTVCVTKDESIRSAYDIFIHEFIHFLKIDPIQSHKDLVEAESFDDIFRGDMLRPGGEVDAYRAGIYVESRLLTYLGAKNPSPQYPFLDNSGEVIDEEAFKTYVFWVYMHQYPTDEAKEEALQYLHSFNQWRIDTLTGVLGSQTLNLRVISGIEKEIDRLKAVNAGLFKN